VIAIRLLPVVLPFVAGATLGVVDEKEKEGTSYFHKRALLQTLPSIHVPTGKQTPLSTQPAGHGSHCLHVPRVVFRSTTPPGLSLVNTKQ
jgi:hypothetical protein